MQHWVIRRIRSADRQQIAQLLKETVRRHNELYPDWEIVTFSIHRSRHQSEQLEDTIRMLQGLNNRAE